MEVIFNNGTWLLPTTKKIIERNSKLKIKIKIWFIVLKKI